jgi:hypothetical protein
LEIAFKQLTGVGEILLGISGRRADPVERFIENCGDALLFRKRREWEFNSITSFLFRPGLTPLARRVS